MVVIIKWPGQDPGEVNIKDRFLGKTISSVIGSDHDVLPFGSGICVLARGRGSADDALPDFQFTCNGERVSVAGPVIFTGTGGSGLAGLDEGQRKIVFGCFGTPLSADNVWAEIDAFLSNLYSHGEEAVLERKNAILARNVIMDPGEGERSSSVSDAEDDSIEDIVNEYVAPAEDVTENADVSDEQGDGGEYIGKHSAKNDDTEDSCDDESDYKSEDEDEEVPEAELPEEAGMHLGQMFLAEEAEGDSPEDAGDTEEFLICEEGFIAYLLESADDMSDKSKQQIVDLLAEKFRACLQEDEFRELVLEHLDEEVSQDDKDAFFRHLTGSLIRSGGVREEYAKRHPDEYRV